MPFRRPPKTLEGQYLKAFKHACEGASMLALQFDNIDIPENYWLRWLQNKDDIKNIIDSGGGSLGKLVTQELPPRGVYTPQVIWTLSVTRHLDRASKFESIELCNSREGDAVHNIITTGTMRHDVHCSPLEAREEEFVSYRLYPIRDNVIRCECIIRLWLDLVWDRTKGDYANSLFLHSLESNTIHHYLKKTFLSPDPLDRASYLDSRGAAFNDPAVMAIRRGLQCEDHWITLLYATAERAMGVDPTPALEKLRERIANGTYE